MRGSAILGGLIASCALAACGQGRRLGSGAGSNIGSNDGVGGGGVHCFLKGTLIKTTAGECPIEELSAGDPVETASGQAKPIKWIWRSHLDKPAGRQGDSAHTLVKISRGALDGHLPNQDLYLTDSHCLFINDLLVRAGDLINGVSIAKQLPNSADKLEVFHLELATHDVVFANGAPAETLQAEVGARQAFDNCEEYLALCGSEPTTMSAYAPIVANYSRLQQIRSQYRSLIAPIYDARRPLDVIRDELAEMAVRA